MRHPARRNRYVHVALFLVLLLVVSCSGPSGDTATFDADGTAHIKRVIPMPSTISPESQKWLDSLAHQKY